MYFYKDNMLTHPYLQYLMEQEVERLEAEIRAVRQEMGEGLDDLDLQMHVLKKAGVPRGKAPNPHKKPHPTPKKKKRRR